jgi:DNA repair protein RadA
MGYNLHIDTFTEMGCNLINRLKEAGFHSIDNLAISSPVDVSNALDIKIDEAISICNKAAIKLEERGIIPKGPSIDRNDWSCHNRSYVKTGSKDLDQLFGGKGIETKAVTQFYGQSATGKTQICHTLCVTVQQLQAHYKSIYIDTEGTFRAERITEIAKAKGLDPTRVLQKVKCIQPLNSARLESVLLQDLSQQLTQDSNIKLLVVDSVINPYRGEYAGRGMLSQRQSRLSKIMHLLQNIARVYDIAVVITNQVQTSVSGYGYCLNNSDRPMGGNVMAHTSTFIIRLKGDSSCLIAEMKGSPCYPEGTICFGIYEGGIKDIPHLDPE